MAKRKEWNSELMAAIAEIHEIHKLGDAAYARFLVALDKFIKEIKKNG